MEIDDSDDGVILPIFFYWIYCGACWVLDGVFIPAIASYLSGVMRSWMLSILNQLEEDE